jgi:GNAT superfamily N-acetyltransferase
MDVAFQLATEDDVAGIAALRLAVARDLQVRFGDGIWAATNDSLAGVRAELRMAQTYVTRHDGAVVATVRLTTKNPWLGDTRFFTGCERPLYLLALAVAPKWQRCGVGRQCLREARRIAVGRGAGAIRLDAFDAPAGAGEFYRKCGFREVHRGGYHGMPLIWFELLV